MATRTLDKWNALRPAYRARLERAGITRERYLSGEPLSSARGHARTPERPERAERHPERYPEYTRARPVPIETFRDQVGLYASGMLFNAYRKGIITQLDLEEVARIVSVTPRRTLSMMLNAGLDDWRDYASRGDTFMTVYYTLNGKRIGVNPFFYH